MTPRERINRAMQRKTPDRVPVWCPLSLEHIVRNGRPDRKFPETVEEFLEIECGLTLRYGFDAVLLYLPMLKKGTAVAPILDRLINNPPVGDSSHNFQTADPEKWELPDLNFTEDDFYSSHLARELIGEDYHIGGWVADGFSKALQWFPALDDALIALLEDEERFKAIVHYFDKICVPQARAQIELGKLESIHISSPYAGSSFISLQLYRELVFESVSKIARAVKQARGFAYLHTCGSISDRLELMAETGIDGIECMDPPPLGNVSLADAKKRVGDKLFLKGNIDSVNVLLRGSDEEVEATVKRCFADGMPGGGYILSTACSVAPLVSPERVRRLSDLADRFGLYGDPENE